VPGVTVPALELYVTAQKAAADETKQVGEDNKKIFESVTAFREAADKRQIESMKILQAEELRQAGLRNEQVRAELDARAQLNAAYGLDVTGHQTMGSALDTYTTKLDALHAKKQENIDQYAQEDLLMKEYTDALLEEAKAQDAATTAADKAPAKVREVGNSMQEAAGKTGVFMNQLHMLVDDPKLAAFFGNTAQGSVATTLYGGGATGMTPEMAAAIAAGQFINMAGVGMPRRAGGGGVQRGTTYLVGERGPELFTPGASSGFITPTGGGGSTINISVTQPLGTPDAIARAVSDALAQQARGRGVRA
jgi:hypothetical protein